MAGVRGGKRALVVYATRPNIEKNRVYQDSRLGTPFFSVATGN